jgi:hypothetical protein
MMMIRGLSTAWTERGASWLAAEASGWWLFGASMLSVAYWREEIFPLWLALVVSSGLERKCHCSSLSFLVVSSLRAKICRASPARRPTAKVDLFDLAVAFVRPLRVYFSAHGARSQRLLCSDAMGGDWYEFR